jgi:hypothetical protein
MLSSRRKWTLSFNDGSIEIFSDIRRKVGNQIIRIYLLDGVLTEERIEKINASLRGPKNEFKDFSNFFILQIQEEEEEIRFLTETGVYENMRIVGTNSEKIIKMDTEEIVKKFTDALVIPDRYRTTFIVNDDFDIKPKG